MSHPSVCKQLLRIAAAAILAVAATMPSIAQSAAVGNIKGTAIDASGAAVAGAAITVINNDTGASRTLTTGASGDFTSPFLQPGHYEVVFTAPGFGKVDRKNLI